MSRFGSSMAWVSGSLPSSPTFGWTTIVVQPVSHSVLPIATPANPLTRSRTSEPSCMSIDVLLAVKQVVLVCLGVLVAGAGIRLAAAELLAASEPPRPYAGHLLGHLQFDLSL